MEVPDAVLDKLKCDNCENYLSRGPVFILDNDRSRCGRCSDPEDSGKRNKPYEELAQLMKFPCRYKENGCEEKLRFEENKVHEEACAFRILVCPIAESGKCDWSGVPGKLLEHCKTAHSTSVIENPSTFQHDITKSSLGNYLLYAYQVLFLVQTKVCTVTRKIYHSVRLLGNPKLVSKYSYKLDISNETDKLTKHGKVAPRGCLALQEDTSVEMDINGLLAVLGGFSETSFTLTVQCKEDRNDKEFLVECIKCKCLTKPVFYDKNWLCPACAPEKFSCKNVTRGCTYKDVVYKIRTHQLYFCQYIQHCTMCDSTIVYNSNRTNHYINCHNGITQMAGNIWTATVSNQSQWCIITSDLGKVICTYRVINSCFNFDINSSLANDQLYKYTCVLKIYSFDNNLTIYSTKATTTYSNWFDWRLSIPTQNLNPYKVNHKILLSIEFTKTQKLSDLCL